MDPLLFQSNSYTNWTCAYSSLQQRRSLLTALFFFVGSCKAYDPNSSIFVAVAVLRHPRALRKCHHQHRSRHTQAILLVRLIFCCVGYCSDRQLASVPQRHGPTPHPLHNPSPRCIQCAHQVSYTYSKCSAEGVRFLAHYYNTPCRLGFPLPPNVNNLPCAVNCASGSYLQPGAVACRFVPALVTPRFLL